MAQEQPVEGARLTCSALNMYSTQLLALQRVTVAHTHLCTYIATRFDLSALVLWLCEQPACAVLCLDKRLACVKLRHLLSHDVNS